MAIEAEYKIYDERKDDIKDYQALHRFLEKFCNLSFWDIYVIRKFCEEQGYDYYFKGIDTYMSEKKSIRYCLAEMEQLEGFKDGWQKQEYNHYKERKASIEEDHTVPGLKIFTGKGESYDTPGQYRKAGERDDVIAEVSFTRVKEKEPKPVLPRVNEEEEDREMDM